MQMERVIAIGIISKTLQKVDQKKLMPCPLGWTVSIHALLTPTKYKVNACLYSGLVLLNALHNCLPAEIKTLVTPLSQRSLRENAKVTENIKIQTTWKVFLEYV